MWLSRIYYLCHLYQDLAQTCQAPGKYGLDNLNRLRLGKLPRSVKHWPCDQYIDPDNTVVARIASAPLYDFERQLLCDHPELSVAESKVVADMLLRCAEYAAQVVPRYIADNPGKAINKVVGNPKP